MRDPTADGSIQSGTKDGLHQRRQRFLAHQDGDGAAPAWQRRASDARPGGRGPRGSGHGGGHHGPGRDHHAAPAHIEHMTEDERAMMHSYESLDYEIVQNELFRDALRAQGGVGPCGSCCAKAAGPCASWQKAQKWAVFALIGMITGIVAYALALGVETLNDLKFNFVREYVHHVEKPLGLGYVYFCLISCGFVTIATYLVARRAS